MKITSTNPWQPALLDGSGAASVDQSAAERRGNNPTAEAEPPEEAPLVLPGGGASSIQRRPPQICRSPVGAAASPHLEGQILCAQKQQVQQVEFPPG